MWTPEKEEKCRLIGNRASAFVWMSNQASAYYNRINKILTVMTTISSYLLGGSGIPVLFATAEFTSKYGNLGIQIGMITVGIIQTVQQVIGVSSSAGKYQILETQNQALVQKIQLELSKEVESRSPYEAFYDDLITMESDLKTQNNDIPKRFIDSYYKTLGTSALSYATLFIDFSSSPREVGTDIV